MAKKKTTKKTPPKSQAPGKNAKEGTLVKSPSRAIAPPQRAKFGGRGFENLEREDILIPRIKLLQANSPEVEGDLAQAKGTVFTIPANRNFGDKVLITPIMHFRSRIKWEGDRAEGDAKIECQSDDGKVPRKNVFKVGDGLCGSCPLSKWKDDEEGKDAIPDCTLYENFVVLLGEEKEPVILPMERTKTKAARKFYSMGAMKNVDFWNHKYELKVIKDQNEAGKHYYNYVVSDIGKKTDDKTRELCETLFNSLSQKTLTPAEMKPEGAEAGGTEGSRDL